MGNVKLKNDLGTGRPKLTMKFVTSDVPFPPESKEIDYHSEKEIPCTWSVWNIYGTGLVDEKNNYFGTITLKDDSGTLRMLAEDYKPPEDRNLNYLADFGLKRTGNSYSLSVARVCADLQPSFPDTPLAKPATRGPKGPPIVLSTKGAKIINDQGNEVVLKGLNRPSLEWNDKGQYLSPLDIKTMRGWGANVIRIPLNQTFWLNSKGRETSGSYKQIVDAMIYYAIENNMAVILDLHWLFKDSEGHPSRHMANKDSNTFWGDIAKVYGNFGTVLFDLYNEPVWQFGTTEELKVKWLSGDSKNPQETTVGYQELYNTVRATGAKNLCIIAGLDWGYDLSFVNSDFGVKGTGIVYCSHPYNAKGLLPNQGPLFNQNFAGVLGKFPVIFSEFGCNLAPPDGSPDSPQYARVHLKSVSPMICTGGEIKPDALKYYKTVIGWVNQHGFHYTGWGWWVDHCQPWWPTLIKNFSGEAINGGVVVQKDLKDNPGTGIG